MNYEIVGRVVEPKSRQGVPGVVVSAFDKDKFFDDRLGDVLSDAAGAFRITFDQSKFRDFIEKKPDLYVTVATLAGDVLLSTQGATRFDASTHEEYVLEVPAETLQRAGLSTGDGPETITREALTTMTCLSGAEEDDLVKQIKADIEGKASLLDVFKEYMGELRLNADNDALPFRKMARLFELGLTPERLNGHFYGVAPGLRTGDLQGVAAEIGNFMGFIWGSVVGDITPWVGKSFTPMAEADRGQVTGESIPEDVPALRGINHFNMMEQAPLNLGLNAVLQFLWHLKEATPAERLQYGYERKGGHFVSHKAPSIWPGSPREVLRLNYRYANLGNKWPLNYLIDEMVEIAKGLYLGQVLFATDHLFEKYDPAAPNERYRYQHFGYFLLFREWWHEDAKRLFPHLEMPDAAVSTTVVGDVPRPAQSSKFTTLTLAEPGDGAVDPELLAEIKSDLKQVGTVVHLIKSYSDALRQELRTDSPAFAKLFTLFNAGMGPATMNGFYRGALVSWQSQGLLALAKLNSINVAWEATRRFSPWTGKKFEPIEKERLSALTNGHETGEVPTFFCSNTVVFRTAKERFARAAAQAMKVWMEDATHEERRLYGYDAKTFFFIGKYAPSIYAPNKGKHVFQFNYRWPALRNPIPDKFCFDEIVQIAEGLYLGQVFYAQNWLEPWDPRTPASKYDYGLFEYFVLMDEEWHAQRLRIGYDLDNT